MPMKSKNRSNEESESEWDSMPEAPRAHNNEEFDPRLQEHTNDQSSASPAKLKKVSKSSATSSTDQSIKGQSGQHSIENPPYNFKSEVETPTHYVESTRPGKAKKGQSYEPLVNGYSKKTPNASFPDAEVVTSSSSSDEGNNKPVYSKIQKGPNSRVLLQPISHKNSAEKKRLRDIGQARLAAEKLLRTQQPNGVDNDAFESEEEVIFDKSKKLNGVVDNLFQQDCSRQNPQDRLIESQRPSISEDQKIYRNDDVMHDINKKLERCFTWMSLPFACIFLFFHHLLKFFLVTLVKPVLIDSLSIISTYFLKPLHNNVLNPIFKNIFMATLSISNIFTNILRPFASLLKSCRLVEFNNYHNEKHKERHVI